MPSIPSAPELPDEADLLAWYGRTTREVIELRRKRHQDTVAWEYLVRVALVAWEREGKPPLPIVDPRSLA